MGALRANSAPAVKPVTAERIERGLDRLAQIMVSAGPEGRVYLPIYERLETELEALRMAEDKMDRVFERVKRSKDRTAARSS